MTANEIAAALYRRHPAVVNNGPLPSLGAWTVLREWNDIDVLAISSYRHPAAGAQRQSSYPRVGYEIKTSRSDYRRELLAPGKRQLATRLICHEFYFAVPAGLLKADELSYLEPAWDYGFDFKRPRCPDPCLPAKHVIFDYRAAGFRANTHVVRNTSGDYEPGDYELCRTCRGRGYSERSRVEREAPTLWVPADVGLVVIGAGGNARCLRKSPVHTPPALSEEQISDLVRWASVRPDPRHEGVAQTQRDITRQWRQMYR